MRIAFIGFGEAARAFRQSLAAQEPALQFVAYDILLDKEGADGPCGEAMRAHGVAIARSPQAAAADADWIISAVTADQCLAAARATGPHLNAGQVFFDINAVSPGRKREAAAAVGHAGAGYVDMAVMAPVHPKGHATPTLLAGEAAEVVSARLSALGFCFEVVGLEPGAATAIKMVRSLFVKGLEAITVETLLAASASGCFDRVLASLEKSYPGLDLPRLGRYHFERTLRHGMRRAAEMRESAATLNALGLKGHLADAIADVQAAMGALPETTLGEGALGAEVERIAALRRK